MKIITKIETNGIFGGHSDCSFLGSGPISGTLLFLFNAPHALLHIKEFVNYTANLYENGCDGVDPSDKVGQWLVCPTK